MNWAGIKLVGAIFFLLPTASAAPMAPQVAGTAPTFLLPFECGAVYTGDTYDNLEGGGLQHGKGPRGYEAMDFNQPGDADDGGIVVASAAGTAHRHTNNPGGFGYGYYVTIDHGGGWQTLYAHLEDTSRIADGATVKAGDPIGRISNSGTTGNHLHYEQNLNGVSQLLRFSGAQAPYWIENLIPGEEAHWAPDAVSQAQTSNGPWTSTPSPNGCGNHNSSLRNGSLERGKNSWRLRQGRGIANRAYYRNINWAHDGNDLVATNTDDNGSIYQDVSTPVTAGDSITATAWVRSQGASASGKLCIWGLGESPNEKNCTRYTVGQTYEPIAVVFNPKDNHSKIRVELYPKANTGTTFLDTVNLDHNNSLRNGSLERGKNSWRLRQGRGIANRAYYRNINWAHDGNDLVATNTDDNGSIYQDVSTPVTAGDSITATAWVRSQGASASGKLCIWGLGESPNEKNCTRYTVGQTYEPIAVVFNPKDNHSKIRVELYPKANTGTTFLDTVNLDHNNSLRNGSLERGKNSWRLRQGRGIANRAYYRNINWAHDGNDLVATNTDDNGSIYQDVSTPVTAGDSITATAWVRSQGASASGKLCIWGLGESPNEKNCTRYTVGQTYEPIAVVFNPKDNHSKIRVELYPKANTGTTFLDTVNLDHN